MPLSNYQVQQQVTNAWTELKRARALQHSGRADWFESCMNLALDVLCERYRAGRSGTFAPGGIVKPARL